jgi:hypothetical protein
VAGTDASPEWVRHNLRREVSSLQKAGRLGSAMRRDRCDTLDLKQDWGDHGPIS